MEMNLTEPQWETLRSKLVETLEVPPSWTMDELRAYARTNKLTWKVFTDARDDKNVVVQVWHCIAEV